MCLSRVFIDDYAFTILYHILGIKNNNREKILDKKEGIKYNKYEKLYLYNGGVKMKNRFVGISKVGEKGQIVIPKEVRDMFDIKAGDCIVVLADKAKGIALVKSETLEDMTEKILGGDK